MQIETIAIVSLTKAEIVEAICDFVGRQNAAEGLEIEPSSIRFMIEDGKEYSGVITAAASTHA